jgi:long-chain acyl-CoA synthetase
MGKYHNLKYHSLISVVERFSPQGDKPAIIAVRDDGLDIWSYHRLDEAILQLGKGLVEEGVKPGEPVALLAPNCPEWVVAFFAIQAAGGMAVPLDDLISEDDLRAILADAGCKRVFTVQKHVGLLRDCTVYRLDNPSASDTAPVGRYWRDLLISKPSPLALPKPTDVASLVYTSGTTGTPKGVPLTHVNLLSNLEALEKEMLITAKMRVLLPLPLHHVFPFTTGMLLTLVSKATLVFPAGISGPQIVWALKQTGVHAMIGVPRLYSAMLAGIESRVAVWRTGSTLFELLLRLSLRVRKRFGWRIGRVLFFPLHLGIAPRLRRLGSGGAHLDSQVAWKLEALGWEVLSGYGLTETSPVLTFNPPGRARIESEGVPLPGVKIQIDKQPGQDFGEIQAKGLSVFGGYWHKPEETAEVFTEEEWFRTGDLGFLDPEGYLHIAGRVKEMIVLPDGKNIFPEAIELRLQTCPYLKEIAVLEHDGLLVGLAVPNQDAIRERGMARVETLLREEIEAVALTLPTYQRLSGYAMLREGDLPRTHLGKLKRHLLGPLYERAKGGNHNLGAQALSHEDQALLADPAAKRVWDWLVARYPGKPVSLDASPQLDLGIDSLEWVSITMELQQRFDIVLPSEALGGIATVRDLLRRVSAGPARAAEASATPQLPLPLGAGLQFVAWSLYHLIRFVMRKVYRLEVEGLGGLPAHEAFLIAPNHSSYLDGFAVAAALDWYFVKKAYWAGWAAIMFSNPLRRCLSRIARVVPIDADREPALSLAQGRLVLEQGNPLVWFPEGRRSPTGEVLSFNPGIGVLVKETEVPVVPVYLQGTFEAWPIHRAWPRRGRIKVVFGKPLGREWAQSLAGDKPNDIANAIREAVLGLSNPNSSDTGGPVA